MMMKGQTATITDYTTNPDSQQVTHQRSCQWCTMCQRLNASKSKPKSSLWVCVCGWVSEWEGERELACFVASVFSPVLSAPSTFVVARTLFLNSYFKSSGYHFLSLCAFIRLHFINPNKIFIIWSAQWWKTEAGASVWSELFDHTCVIMLCQMWSPTEQ